METFAVLVGFVALSGLVVGAISIVRPIKALRIHSRRIAVGVVVLSIGLMLAIGPLLPEVPEEAEPEAGSAIPTTTSTTTEARTTSSSTSTPTTSKPVSSTSTSSTSSTTTTSTTVSTTTTQPPTVDEQVEAGMRAVVEDDYISSVATEIDPNSYVVAATFEGSDNLTMNLIAGSILIDTSEVFRAVFDLGYEVQYTTIEVMFPLVDQFGNTELGRLALVRLEGSLYDQINQDLHDATLNLDIIPGLAEWLFVHPSLAETEHFTELLG